MKCHDTIALHFKCDGDVSRSMGQGTFATGYPVQFLIAQSRSRNKGFQHRETREDVEFTEAY
jgi:hypothetical protein